MTIISQPTQPGRWIYISPHFDDAVLSCGGLIWEQTQAGIPVEIWTVFGGYTPNERISPLARRIHNDWKTTTVRETITLRRAEDRSAAGRVGASVVHLDMLDAIYRKGTAGRSLYLKKIMRPPTKADLQLGIVESIQSAIAAVGFRADDTVVCQLAIGGHVDHRLVRMAVERLGRPLLYSIDIPYYLNHPDELPRFEKNMTSQVLPVSDAALRAWQDGIAEYVSQIPTLFADNDDMRQKIAAYRQQNGGLRLLRPM